MKIWSKIRDTAKHPNFILFLLVIYISFIVTRIYIKPPPQPIDNTTDKVTSDWRR